MTVMFTDVESFGIAFGEGRHESACFGDVSRLAEQTEPATGSLLRVRAPSCSSNRTLIDISTYTYLTLPDITM